MKSYSMRASTRQAGFTLVELVVVITILGILAAVALPRFTDLQRDARASKAQGLVGSVRAAAAQVKATSIARAVNCGEASGGGGAPIASSLVLEGVTINTVACYPTSADIVKAANIEATADNVAIDTTTTAGTAVITVAGAVSPGTCSVTYVQPTAPHGAPVITVATAGC